MQGVNCLGVSDWVGSLQGCLAGTLLLVATSIIIIATIACSNGVQLVTFAGALQAFAAWGLLLQISRLPTAPTPPSGGVGWPWLLQKAWRVFGLLCDMLLSWLITLASLFNMLMPIPAEVFVLLDGLCCSNRLQRVQQDKQGL